jgi:alkaline phosphatase D
MLRRSLLALAFAALSWAQDTRPYVLLISIDGFRYDYAAKHGAPNLTKFGEQGVRAEALIPQFPSTTFPNHLSIITGLRPEHHGIIENVFFDPARKTIFRYNRPETSTDGSWYKGTPLWVLAEQQGVRTGSFFWPGSDAEIQGIRPRDYRRYEEAIPNAERVRQAIDWFARPESVRPHFVTLYFSDVDSAGHTYGPDADETRKAVKDIDALLGKLFEGVRATGAPVNVFVVSDHGMIHPGEPIRVGAQSEFAGFDIAAFAGTDLRLWTADAKLAQATAAKLNGRDSRFKATALNGQVLITPTASNYLYIEQAGTKPPTPSMGVHGFDARQFPEMRGIFYAQGPGLKSGVAIPAFENIDIYPLIARLLRLTPSAQVDGKPDTLMGILK